jgi:hypothetical protein
LGSIDVVKESWGAAIEIVRPLVAAELFASETVAVNVNCPAPDGVPEIAPLGVIDRPAGKVPEARDQT